MAATRSREALTSSVTHHHMHGAPTRSRENRPVVSAVDTGRKEPRCKSTGRYILSGSSLGPSRGPAAPPALNKLACALPRVLARPVDVFKTFWRRLIVGAWGWQANHHHLATKFGTSLDGKGNHVQTHKAELRSPRTTQTDKPTPANGQ